MVRIMVSSRRRSGITSAVPHLCFPGLINHSKLSKSETSGKRPTESKDGQAEEGAEGGIERLNLGRGLGSP